MRKRQEVVFDELLEIRTFRQLLRSTRLLATESEKEIQRARRLWSERYPSIDFSTCLAENCNELVMAGELCKRHVSKSLPTWIWLRGTLYRFVRIRFAHRGKFSGQHYEPYAHYVAKKKFGSIPLGYDVHIVDANPFRLASENLVILSHAMKAAVTAGRICVVDAIEADSRIADLVNSRGGRPQSVSLIRYADIARETNLTESAVRASASRGRFDMDDPRSVLRFVTEKSEKNKGF